MCTHTKPTQSSGGRTNQHCRLISVVGRCGCDVDLRIKTRVLGNVRGNYKCEMFIICSQYYNVNNIIVHNAVRPNQSSPDVSREKIDILLTTWLTLKVTVLNYKSAQSSLLVDNNYISIASMLWNVVII